MRMLWVSLGQCGITDTQCDEEQPCHSGESELADDDGTAAYREAGQEERQDGLERTVDDTPYNPTRTLNTFPAGF